ncbi:hypothetical protein WJX72_011649 [[Myrmecia] bisecta]|uniref:Uncharacterized protein n=1 Tax=[Myrmecia] bisecta TaxID=41462 RepID=A0AAW1QT32_9CHLO
MTKLQVTDAAVARDIQQALSGSAKEPVFEPWQPTAAEPRILDIQQPWVPQPTSWLAEGFIVQMDVEPLNNTTLADLRMMLQTVKGDLLLVFMQACKAKSDKKLPSALEMARRIDALKQAVSRWRKTVVGAPELEVIFAWATTARAPKSLHKLAKQRSDFVLFDQTTMDEWCPLAHRMPLLYNENAAVSGVVQGIMHILEITNPEKYSRPQPADDEQ